MTSRSKPLALGLILTGLRSLGRGFTAAKPSTNLITSLYANRSMHQQERVALLREQHSNACGRPRAYTNGMKD